jgi:hypothetical protein
VNGSRDGFPPGDEFPDSELNASFGETVDSFNRQKQN